MNHTLKIAYMDMWLSIINSALAILIFINIGQSWVAWINVVAAISACICGLLMYRKYKKEIKPEGK